MADKQKPPKPTSIIPPVPEEIPSELSHAGPSSLRVFIPAGKFMKQKLEEISLPNVPSPLSKASFVSDESNVVNSPELRNRHTRYSEVQTLGGVSTDDVFSDDRSLEEKIRRSLKQSPKSLMLDLGTRNYDIPKLTERKPPHSDSRVPRSTGGVRQEVQGVRTTGKNRSRSLGGQLAGIKGFDMNQELSQLSTDSQEELQHSRESFDSGPTEGNNTKNRQNYTSLPTRRSPDNVSLEREADEEYRISKLIRRHRQDMQLLVDSRDDAVNILEVKLGEKQTQIDKLKYQLENCEKEIEELNATSVQKSQQFDADLERAKGQSNQELKQALDKVEEMSAERKRFKFREESDRLELIRLRAALKEANKEIGRLNRKHSALGKESDGNLEEKERLKAELEGVTKISEQLREKSLKDNEELKRLQQVGLAQREEMTKLQTEIENEKRLYLQAEIELKDARTENESYQAQIKELQSVLQHDQQKQNGTVQALHQQQEDLKKEIVCLETDLRETKSKCNDLTAEKVNLRKQVALLRRTLNDTGSQKQAQSPSHTEIIVDSPSIAGTSITERLVRIRDAAEKAALAKDHKRELGRFKAQHEKAIEDLVARHEETIQTLLKDTKAEIASQKMDVSMRLQAEFDEKLEKVEHQHQLDISKLKEEQRKNSEITDESLQLVVAKLSAAKQRIEREIAKREQLEGSIKRIQIKFENEKHELEEKHKERIQKLKQSWNDEKNMLLGVIQKDCNSVFERNRNVAKLSPEGKSVSRWSPRSVTSELVEISSRLAMTAPESPNETSTSSTERASPEYYSIDEALRETEALVENLVGLKIDTKS